MGMLVLNIHMSGKNNRHFPFIAQLLANRSFKSHWELMSHVSHVIKAPGPVHSTVKQFLKRVLERNGQTFGSEKDSNQASDTGTGFRLCCRFQNKGSCP